MTLKQFSLDGTLDVDVTAVNSGLSMFNRAGGVIKFAERGIVLTSPSGGANTITRYETTTDTNNLYAFRGSFMLPAPPAADLSVLRIRETADDNWAVNMVIDPTGIATLYDRMNDPIEEELGTLVAGTWYDIALIMAGGSDTAGSYTGQLFVDSTETPFAVAQSDTAANMTTGAIKGFEIGICSGNPSSTVYWDNVQMDSGRTTNIPVYAPPPATFDTYFGLDGAWVPGNLYVGDGTWRSITDAGVGA